MSSLTSALAHELGAGFTVERELSPGGMSRVFVALDLTLNRRVAVKILSRELAAAVSTERFLREVQTLATLQHPNIVAVLSSGTVDGLPYYVMPFIEGESLRSMIRRSGSLPVRDVVRLLRDIARALAFAHERGVVHRDIKPDNVLLADGAAIVSDFGVAKAVDAAQRTGPGATGAEATQLTMQGSSVGTPAYMAPEQVAADPTIDHRADIYSFGVLAYEMLAGGNPFDSKTPQAVFIAHLTQTPEPIQQRRIDAPPSLAALVTKCLQKDRDHRPQTAREVLDLLDSPYDSKSFSNWHASFEPAGANARWIAVAAVVACVAIGGMVWWRSSHRSAQPGSTIAGDARALLVMPFDNIGSDSSKLYVTDGMRSELVGALAAVPGIRLILHTPTATEQQRYGTVEGLARALGANTILAGSVRHHAPQVRVSARLVNVTDGAALWASSYDRTIDDVFDVQDDIVRAIGATIGTKTAQASGATTHELNRGTASADAFDLFLRARYLFDRRGADGLRRAIVLTTQALAIDSTFARAYALRAQIISVLPLYTGATAAADSLKAAGIDDATRAVALDSLLPDAFTARATLFNASFRWADAERDYRRALALRPDDPVIHQWLGEHLLVRGLVPDGVAQLREAARLDPLSPVIQASFALATAIGGNRAEGIRVARRAVDLDSSFFVTRLMLGSVLLFDQQFDKAVEQLREADRLVPQLPTVQGMYGFALARNGKTAEARAMLDRVASSSGADADVAVAHIALALGETDRALDALERAVKNRAPQLTAESLFEPIFEELTKNPRFISLLRTLGVGATR